jgi:hypothetical protein
METAKYGEDFAKELKPILRAVDEALLAPFRPDRSGRMNGLYLALGKLLTLDPNIRDQGLDITRPLVAMIRPSSRQDAAIFMQIMTVPANELPAPDLLVRVALPSTNPSRLLHHLEGALARDGSCTSARHLTGKAGQMCVLAKHGLVVLELDDRLVHVDLLSGSEEDSIAQLEKVLGSALQKTPAVGLANIEEARVGLMRDRAVLAATIPGRMVRPIMQVHYLAQVWSFVLASSYRSAVHGQRAELALHGSGFLGEYLLSLPGRLEVENTRIALVLDDSAHIAVDIDLTTHGAKLLDLGMQALMPHKAAGREDVFDGQRLLSSVEPVQPLYDFDSPNDESPREMAPEGLFLARTLLQSPALMWNTIASTMRPEHRTAQHLWTVLANGLGLKDVSWRSVTKGRGTLADISLASRPKGNAPAIGVMDVRAWIASSRRLRLEACILPNRLPCGQSSCVDEVLLEDVAPPAEESINPCWERSLLELHQLFTRILWGPLPEVGSPQWFQHVMPLHSSLVCASKDPDIGAVATEMDQALARFVAQKGDLIPIDAQPKPFFHTRSHQVE